MWLFTRYGFYSVSAQGQKFVVRARLEYHLVALLRRFPNLERHGAAIIETPRADYRWRIEAQRHAWRAALSEMADEQTWPNFKAEAERFNGPCEYTESLHRVWGEMFGLQLADVRRDRGGIRMAPEAQAAYDAEPWPGATDNNPPAPKKRGLKIRRQL